MDPRFQDPTWLAGNCDVEIPFERACAVALRRQQERINVLQDALGLVELWMQREREVLVACCRNHDGSMAPDDTETIEEHDSRLRLVTTALQLSRAPAPEVA